jgi:hypothetical protein
VVYQVSDQEYKDRYWLVYDVISQRFPILNNRGIFDEDLIKAKVEESINKNAFNKE